jgi:hypothetical protein
MHVPWVVAAQHAVKPRFADRIVVVAQRMLG